MPGEMDGLSSQYQSYSSFIQNKSEAQAEKLPKLEIKGELSGRPIKELKDVGDIKALVSFVAGKIMALFSKTMEQQKDSEEGDLSSHFASDPDVRDLDPVYASFVPDLTINEYANSREAIYGRMPEEVKSEYANAPKETVSEYANSPSPFQNAVEVSDAEAKTLRERPVNSAELHLDRITQKPFYQVFKGVVEDRDSHTLIAMYQNVTLEKFKENQGQYTLYTKPK